MSSWRNKTLKGPERLSSSPASRIKHVFALQISAGTVCYFTEVPESETGQFTEKQTAHICISSKAINIIAPLCIFDPHVAPLSIMC
jgi:hypothetical protein